MLTPHLSRHLQQLINSLTAELKQLQAAIQDNQYQILVLQTNGNFNLQEKLQAIKYLQTELGLLVEKLAVMAKVPDYTRKDDIQKTNDQILLVDTELAKLIPPKKITTHVSNT